jgi:hypothetical protein
MPAQLLRRNEKSVQAGSSCLKGKGACKANSNQKNYTEIKQYD